MVFNGSCNTELFEAWVGQFLIKELQPGQVVIMDNASFHKSKKTKELRIGRMQGHFLAAIFTRFKSNREILGEYEKMD